MKYKFIYLLVAAMLMSGAACTGGKGKPGKSEKKQNMKENSIPVTLMTLDPGHFHAALVQKTMYDQVSPEAYVYAPAGPEVREFLDFIKSFNTRQENPTSWQEKVYTGPDFLDRMLSEKPGNVVVISGDNARKTEYIKKSVEQGLNVFADKPMVITPKAYPLLEEAFNIAKQKGVLLYDIMTERYEITTVLQREISLVPDVFGKLQQGSAKDPALIQKSVHRFYKNVAGKALIRPAWFFDVKQEGEGIADVGTHLVDLIQWSAFPKKIIHKKDIHFLSARHWTTDLSPKQFKIITGLDSYPGFLKDYVNGDTLKIYSNGEVTYKIKGITARVSVAWTYHTPENSDTRYSLMRGTRCDLMIKQGEEENFKPTLYIKAGAQENPEIFANTLHKAIDHIAVKYPGIRAVKVTDSLWKMSIPQKYDVGHEAHFRQVTEKFLGYLQKRRLPEWEVPDMITKYYITTEALRIARGNN